MDISLSDWNDWVCESPRELMKPVDYWEGGEEPNKPSIRGEIGKKVNQLRDPFVFKDQDQHYLLYTGAGEQAIGIVKLEKIES